MRQSDTFLRVVTAPLRDHTEQMFTFYLCVQVLSLGASEARLSVVAVGVAPAGSRVPG